MPLIAWMHWLTGYGTAWAHRLGIPIVTPLTAFLAWPELLFWLTSVGALGVWLAAPRPMLRDPWLGGALVLLALSRFVHGPLVDPEVVLLFVFGAFLFAVVRSAPATARATACRALGAAGLLQASIVIQQARGVDLGGGILYSASPLKMLGTFGNPGMAGGFIAMTALLGAAWMLPVAAVAIWLTHSMAALLAFGVGLAVRYRTSWLPVLVGSALIVAAATGLAGRIAAHPSGVTGATLRARIWALAATDPCPGKWLIGCGLGSWSRHIPVLQTAAHVGFDNEPGDARTCCYWTTAHNDPLQWVYETGAAGCALLIGWLVAHRAMFAHAVAGGAVAALLVQSLTWFPFHTYALALPALVLLGCAAAPQTAGGG